MQNIAVKMSGGPTVNSVDLQLYSVLTPIAYGV